MLTYKVYSVYRDVKGYTDYKLSKEIGVSRTTLWNWKNDLSYPRLETLIHICEKLDIPKEKIVE